MTVGTTIHIISSATEDDIIGIRGNYHDAIINSKIDKKLFVAVTQQYIDGGAPVLIVGRKTYDSLPASMKTERDPRHYIVLTHGNLMDLPGNARAASNFTEVMHLVAGRSGVFVIGGAQIFEAALEYAQEKGVPTYLYLTRFGLELAPLIEDSAIELIQFRFDVTAYTQCDKYEFIDDLILVDCQIATGCRCEFILYQII